MSGFSKYILAVAASAAVFLAAFTLLPTGISDTKAPPGMKNEADRELPLDLLTSLLQGGFGGIGGGGSNSTPGNASAIKLYWQLGYFWQEEPVERKWCMRCGGGCSEGNKVRLTSCDSASSPPTPMIINQDTVIPATVPLDLMQIEAAGTGLCLEAVPETDVIFLSRCGNFVLSRNQWFFGYNETFADRFEIRPFIEPNSCVTQIHHPKNDEELLIQLCEVAREDNTSYWNMYV